MQLTFSLSCRFHARSPPSAQACIFQSSLLHRTLIVIITNSTINPKEHTGVSLFIAEVCQLDVYWGGQTRGMEAIMKKLGRIKQAQVTALNIVSVLYYIYISFNTCLSGLPLKSFSVTIN